MMVDPFRVDAGQISGCGGRVQVRKGEHDHSDFVTHVIRVINIESGGTSLMSR